MIKSLKTLLAFTFLTLLLSCESQQPKEAFSDKSDAYKTQDIAEKSSTGKSQQANRKLIKTGELRFETSNAKLARQNISDLTQKHKGYMGEDNVTGFDDRIEYELEVRIPAESFDAFINELTSGLKHIEHQDISISDVTSRYIDLEARLKSKQQLEARYLKLLDKANKVEDMLKIEAEIEKVRSDIESMQARLKQMSKNVAYSKLQISFYEIKGQTNAIGRKAVQAFVEGWNLLLKVLVGLLNIWPFLIIIGLVLYFIIRYDKKIKHKAEKEDKQE
ncbi:hypothetical protein L21SP5_01611 [Salinivirga cyanobacteriivorans]|uniref:DUF4349 domain-containing protein n=1 Tax=Salinivirga cyanobacteriivorans TaxID=1307839 RepID=A0A0S2HZ40_9BACT|nr:DUF4349 domain-containing protein [Salinivirga cyanobacteriivorans]ALO15254.1 hypothetical protein L21SP5_01611 [Salinivirga cyanobacteriivorans]